MSSIAYTEVEATREACQTLPPLHLTFMSHTLKTLLLAQALWEDVMIAATARIHDLILATRNERDFKELEVRVLNPFKS